MAINKDDLTSPLLCYLGSLIREERNNPLVDPASSRNSAIISYSNQCDKSFFSRVRGDGNLSKQASSDTDDGSGGSNKRLECLLQKKMAVLKKIKALSTNPDTMSEAAEFFTPYVDKHWELARLYTVVRKRLLDDLAATKDNPDADELLVQKVADVMIFAALLEAVHDQCLNVPREKRIYLRNQREFDQLLFDRGFNSKISWESDPTLSEFGTQYIREFIQRINPFRLLVLRTRRECILVTPLVQNYSQYQQGLNAIEQGGSLFFFTNLAWIFFLPRLLINISLIYKHVFDASAMTELELALGWKTRLRAQLVRRWQELANDAAWFSSGITTCFFLAGTVPGIGIYLAVAMQAYDLVVVLRRYRGDLVCLNNTRDAYLAAQSSLGHEEMELFIEDFNRRIAYDRRVLIFSACNFLVLLLCVILTTPVFAHISLLIPVLAAAVAILITIVNYGANQWFERQRPKLGYGNEVISSKARASIMTDTVPAENVSDIRLGVFSAGYIRVKAEGVNTLYYVNKLTGVRVDLTDKEDFKEEYLKDFDRIMFKRESHNKVKTITEDQLRQLNDLDWFDNTLDEENGNKNTDIINRLSTSASYYAGYSDRIMG